MEPKKDQLDKMRERLDLNTLEEGTKKRLFKKFTDVGGKVINLEDKEQENLLQNKTSQSGSIRKTPKGQEVENHQIRPSQETLNPFKSTQVPVIKATIPADVETKTTWWSFYTLRLGCFFGRITNLSGTKFTQKFIDLTLKSIYAEYIFLQLFLDPIFKDPTPESLRFREYIYQNNMLFDYEMAYHAYNLFNKTDFVSLQKTMLISVEDSEKYFLSIYRQFDLFFGHVSQMKISTSLIIKKYEEFFHQKVNQHFTVKKLNTIFELIWTEWRFSIDDLVHYYWGSNNRKQPYLTFHQFFHGNVVSPPQIGMLSKEWEIQSILQQQQEEEEKENEIKETTSASFPSEDIAKGVAFIRNNIDFVQYMAQFQSGKDLRALFQADDQVFYSYILVDYFDKEYTGVWNGVQFYVVPGGDMGRFDPKKELKTLNNKLHQFYELVNGHLRFLKTNQPYSIRGQEQYNEKKEREITRSSFQVRQSLTVLAFEYEKLFNKIISSKETPDDMLGNWTEKILTTKTYEHKLLYETTVEEIFSLSYEYMSALHWLLEYSDLSGLSGKIAKMAVLPNHLLSPDL